MKYPTFEIVCYTNMHHEDGKIEAHRWMDENGRPTEKIKIIKKYNDGSVKRKTFDGETAWSQAANYWNDTLHWSSNWIELPTHPPL